MAGEVLLAVVDDEEQNVELLTRLAAVICGVEAIGFGGVEVLESERLGEITHAIVDQSIPPNDEGQPYAGYLQVVEAMVGIGAQVVCFSAAPARLLEEYNAAMGVGVVTKPDYDDAFLMLGLS